MRRIVSAAAIAAATCSPAAAQKKAASRPTAKPAAPAPKVLPVFDFMGDNTESVTSRTEIGGDKCSNDGSKLSCTDYGRPKLAGVDLKWLSLDYNNGKLYRVMGNTWTHRFLDLVDAFSAKYGKPVLTNGKWQSKGGATFDNVTATWSFKGGDLELSRLGSDLESSTFMFISGPNSPERLAPKVDF